MYEEHEDGSFTLHLCEWYEQGRRLVGKYETLADGSGFAVTDEWSTGGKVVVNHPLTRPDGTVMPGVSRLRRFDWRVGPEEGLRADDYEIWERELREQTEHDRFDGELRSWERWATGNPSSTDSQDRAVASPGQCRPT